MNSLFYELIRVAIGTQDSLSRLPSQKEWKALYDMAKKQSLVGVCFAALQRLGADADEGFARIGMSERLYLTWMGMTAQIQKKNETVNQQCAELQAKLSADGLRSCILKGQGVASLYSELLLGLRQSGDIDLWVDADAESVIKYVKKVSPTNDIERKHISLKIFEDTEVEVHWVPSELDNPFKNKKLKAWYESEKNACFENRIKIGVGGSEICVPTVEFNVIYLLLHIYEHYLYEGVGLRQMMDYYFALCASYDNHADNDNLSDTLRSLGLMKFAGAVMYVMREVFGMEEEKLLCEPDEVFGKRLLDEIMVGGNFGKYGKDGHHKDESKGEWAVRRLGRTLRLFRYDPIGAMCRPIIRLRLALWYKKLNNN